MIKGIGIDLVELPRIKKIVQEKPKFVQRILTDKEFNLFSCLSEKRQVEFLAGRFACKEAFSKAYGTGIGKVDFKDIEILVEDSGKPYISFSPAIGPVHVSISHTDALAVAEIIIEE